MGQNAHNFIIRHGVTVKSDLHKRHYFINRHKHEISLNSDKNIEHFAWSTK